MREFWNLAPSDHAAFIKVDGSKVSYAQLANEVTSFRERLGPQRGLIGIQCDGDFRQYVAYLAALGSGFPVVLMAANQTAESTGLTLRYLYEPKADRLTQVSEVGPRIHPHMAVLLSTSGSTGATKWVRLSFENVAHNAMSIAKYLNLSSDDRAPMALPFQYSYGMSIINSHLSVGATVVLTEGSIIEPQFWKTFEAQRCTSLAGVPHSFDLLTQSGIKTAHLTHLRYMTQAGGRLAPSKVSAWVQRGRDEGWDFFVMYGQTEAGPRISYMKPEQALKTPSAIGSPVPGGRMWVADEAGNPVPDGTRGELFYRGPNTMMGYARGDDDLCLGRGSDVLETGDIAFRHPEGVFEIVGRKSRFVKLYGYRVGLDEVEKHLSERGMVTACAAMNDTMFVLVSKGDREQTEPEAVTQEISRWLNIPEHAFQVHAVDAIPRLENGKVDNRKVQALVEKLTAPRGDRAAWMPFLQRILGRDRREPASVEAVFKKHFSRADVDRSATFRSLGGDSLSYLSVGMELEKVMGALPENWGDLSIEELEQRVTERGWMARLDMPTLIRSLAIMLIVLNHFGVWNYGGDGAYALFMVAGWTFGAFTLRGVLENESSSTILVLIFRVALITFALTLLNYVVTGWGSIPAFFFIGNWISPGLQGSAWFIDVYVQTLLLITVLLAFPAVRRAFSENAFRMSAYLAGGAVAVAALSDAVIDMHHLYRRVPHLLGWFFLTGMAANAARTNLQRGIVSAIFLAGHFQFHLYELTLAKFGVFAALGLIWVQALPVPRLLSLPFRSVAGASLMIYLTHFNFYSLTRKLLFDDPTLAWGVAILGGVVIWKLYEPLDAFLSRKLSGLALRWSIDLPRIWHPERSV